jgi:YjbE family integral membrane protein
MEFASPAFWFAVVQIILIDIVLSGDNAVVIAMACRNLAPDLRRRGILWGVGGAIGLRILLTAFAASLLGYPYLKIICGIALLWIGIKLPLPGKDEAGGIAGADNLWGAVRTIVVADFVMSLDNVVAVAAAARDSLLLLLFGLLVSIPLIVWTSQWFMRLMDRFPIIIVFGAGLLGYVGGSMVASDPLIKGWLDERLHTVHYVIGAFGAGLVMATATWLARRQDRLTRKEQ